MNKKHIMRLGAIFLALTLLGGILSPLTAFSTEGTPTSDSPLPIDETTPVTNPININSNYFAGDNNQYTIHFTPMETIPAFSELKFTVTMTESHIDTAAFSENVLSGATKNILRGENYATYQLNYTTATGIPEKTQLCTLVLTSPTAPSAENLSITDFSIIKENETEATPFSPILTIEAGPIIPELDESTQSVYDSIIALPDPKTISFYQGNGALTDIAALSQSVTAVQNAYDALTDQQKSDMEDVMIFYGKSKDALSALPPILTIMKNHTGLIQIAQALQSISAENALSYQFISEVYQAKKTISVDGLPVDSTAYAEISAISSTVSVADTLITTAISAAESNPDRMHETKENACKTQLSLIQTLSSHQYYEDYLVNLESQISDLINKVTTDLSSRPSLQQGLLTSLSDIQSTIDAIQGGLTDIPTMSLEEIALNFSYEITFNRKQTLSNNTTATISVIVTDAEGNEIDAEESVFPPNEKKHKISITATSSKYTKGETYTATAYYTINGAKVYIGSSTHTCTSRTVPNTSGLGNATNTESSGGLGIDVSKPATDNSGIITPSEPTTGGTIFPSAGSAPSSSQVDSTESKLFYDIKSHKWAQESIEALYYAGIINGMAEGEFWPAASVTREQFAKMVTQLFNISVANADTNFVDVDSTAWYAPYINAALQAGYIQGQSDEYFGIGESIMRQDMATILYRALGNQNRKATLNFTDNENIASYAKDAIAELVGLGIINGYEDGSFNPRGTATRAEAAKMIYGVYQYLNN